MYTYVKNWVAENNQRESKCNCVHCTSLRYFIAAGRCSRNSSMATTSSSAVLADKVKDNVNSEFVWSNFIDEFRSLLYGVDVVIFSQQDFC